MNAWFPTGRGDARSRRRLFCVPASSQSTKQVTVRMPGRGWRSRRLFGGRQPVQGRHQFIREEIEAVQPALLVVPIV